jgi:hypothetical protein
VNKYFKPTSVTWWGGVGLLILGIVESYQTKSLSPKLGEALVAIGLRGAIS